MKFLFSLLILLASLSLQFFAASFGCSFDLAFATLIAFAFLFDFAELLPLTLLGVLVLNWQPSLSFPWLVYLGFPLLAYGFRRFFPTEPLVAIPVAVALAIVVLGFAAGAPVGWGVIFLDILVSAAWALGLSRFDLAKV